MARLPVPGSDNNTWGDILNEFINIAHKPDGTLKNGIVSAANLASGAVTTAAITDNSIPATKLAVSNTPSAGQVLAHDGSGLSWTTVGGSGTVSDASNSQKGVVQLAGDLGGTAVSPTVPGLAGKLSVANNLSDVANASSARANLGLGSSATMSPAQIATDSSLTNAFADKTATANSLSSLGSRVTTVEGAVGSQVTIAALPAGTTLTVMKSSGVWPARPTSRSDIIVHWKGAEPSPSIVSSGTAGMLDNVDMRIITP